MSDTMRELEHRAEMETGPWDADAAMAKCSTASDFRSICAGEVSAGEPDERQHWKLPHHSTPGGPANANGVRAARSRFEQTEGLTNKEAARRHLFETHKLPSEQASKPPRDQLVRAAPPGSTFAMRQEQDSDGAHHLVGHFTPFGDWTEIDSFWEGNFLERSLKGAFRRTFENNRDRLRVTLNHGHDPQLGDKPLGKILRLEEDDKGPAYDVRLFASVPDLVIDGLREEQYGASYRFRVVREEFNNDPGISDYNPKGLPERTILEAEVYEFGPVTYPAYEGATAQLRSITDEYIADRLTGGDPDRLRDILEHRRTIPPDEQSTADAPAAPSPPEGTSAEAARDSSGHDGSTTEEGSGMAVDLSQHRSLDDLVQREKDNAAEIERMLTAVGVGEFSAEEQAKVEELEQERGALQERIAEVRKRHALLADIAKGPNAEPGAPTPETRAGSDGAGGNDSGGRRTYGFNTPDRPIENVWDLGEYRRRASNISEERRLLQDGARRALEQVDFPAVGNAGLAEGIGKGKAREDSAYAGVTNEQVRAHIEALVKRDNVFGLFSRHILMTGSERYRRAFWKMSAGEFLTSEEQFAIAQANERALSLTGAQGGFAVPFVLDPTIIPTGNLAVNPFRSISRVENITVDEWRGISSAGITASFAAEATETTDNAPTLVQPTVSTEKAQGFIPFSIEIGQDWTGLEATMGVLIGDSKDELEATKFATGTGTNEPQGVITGATTTTTAGGTGAFAATDLDLLEAALGARFRARASMVMNRFIAQKIRHFDTTTAGGFWSQGVQLTQGLQSQVPGPGNYGATVIGYPSYESTAMAAALTTGSKIIAMGDFRYYLIADRIGMSVVPTGLLVGTNHRPTGQQGLYFYWRVGAGVLSANAFRVLVTG
jgi:HK97 family phage major capsid protein